MSERNKIYLADNIGLLEKIPSSFIDLIYIDPPFYSQENYEDFSDEWSSLEDYLEFMKIRIEKMHSVLKETGSFYLHCDYHASHYLKIMCDKIFGYDKFRSEIVWQCGSVSGFKSQKQGWIRDHDVILYYVKSDEFTFNKRYLPYNSEYYKRFRYKDENNQKYALSNGRRIYLKDRKGIPFNDVWTDIMSYQTRTRSKDYTGYRTQKPTELLERIIKASSNEGDIVADFFCGSGTTLVTAKILRRDFIGCDSNEEAVALANERVSEANRFQDIKTYTMILEKEKKKKKKVI